MNYQKKQIIQLLGNDVMGFWTQRALSREGYQVTCEEVGNCSVKLIEDSMEWEIHNNGETRKCQSIQDLLAYLRTSFSVD